MGHFLAARALLNRASINFVSKTCHGGNVSAEQEILNYLELHPEAKDTLEGIGSWWLSARDASEAKAALEALAARGLVNAERGPDGRVYYCRASARSKPAGRSPAHGDGNNT
jgi:hypothetical protein